MERRRRRDESNYKKHAFNRQRPQHVQVEGDKASKTLTLVMYILTIFLKYLIFIKKK